MTNNSKPTSSLSFYYLFVTIPAEAHSQLNFW